MLGDVEKKAIDKLKRSANYFVMPMYETKIILELIEKQSKEIEELKKYEKYYEEMEEVNKKFISVDKIKAKIEELKERPNKMVIDKEIPEEYKNIFLDENAILVLQSLLEKE